jgi:acetyl esterase/lipase
VAARREASVEAAVTNHVVKLVLVCVVVTVGVLVIGCGSATQPARSGEPMSGESASASSTAASVGSEPMTVAYGPADSQYGELSMPAGTGTALPVVVLIHGGFWSAAYGLDLMRPLARDLVARGYAVWNIEYRRVGESGGGYPGTLDDVGAAIDDLATFADHYSLDLSRVALVGHSAGGHLALWAAGRTNAVVNAVVAIGQGPVVDLAGGARAGLGGGAIVSLMGGSPDEQPDRYEIATPATPAETHIVVVRGGADSIVPAEFTLPASRAGAIEVIDIEGDDHFDLIEPTSASWAAVIGVLPSA